MGRGAKPTSSASRVGVKALLVKKEAEVDEGFGQGRIQVVFNVDEEEISISRREKDSEGFTMPPHASAEKSRV